MNTCISLLVLVVITAAHPFVEDGKRTVARYGTCPPSSGMAGICVFIPGVNCLSDSECTLGEKCCPEGCGRVCKRIVRKRSMGSCPKNVLLAKCLVDINLCSADTDCSTNQKCCYYGCGKRCINV